jgi:hypothetical protein
MSRPADWPERLAAEISAARLRPFVWGSHDCFTWAAHVAHRLGGPDLMRHVPDPWANEAEATQVMRSLGPDLSRAVGAVCIAARMQRVGTLCAQRGDLVVIETPAGLCTGICTGRSVVVMGRSGLVLLPVKRAVAAWAVG